MSLSTLKRLELENFKSYKGRQLIGPFQHNFVAIIGPNGSGKSNIMDAICFVLGVQTSALRGNQLRDLIYREEDQENADQLNCSVALVLGKEDGSEVQFKRSVVFKGDTATSVYSVDGKKTALKEYEERLQEMDVMSRTRNFLVFQGDVTNIGGTGNGAGLTKLFEQVSGSAELEAEYEELRQAKEKAEEATVINFHKKRGMDAEKKQFKEQESEAKHYRDLLKKQKQLRTEQMTFELSYINTELKTLSEQANSANNAVMEAEEKLAELEQELETAQKKLGKSKRLRLEQERDLATKTKEHMKLNPNVIDLRKEAEHLAKKIERGREKETLLKREVQTQDKELKDLERQLFEIQSTRKEWEEEVRRKRASSIALDDAQLDRYNMLKEEAARESLLDSQKVSELRSRLSIKKEELGALVAKAEGLKRHRGDLEENMRVLKARMQQQEAVVEETRLKMADMEKKIAEKEANHKKALEQRDALTESLVTVQEQLREEKMERKQSERERKFVETVDALKRLYPGVRGRLCDLAEPRQRKYQVAAAVAMGRNMDAIVVDDRQTAVECLKYVKSQKAGVALFLPLDSIHPKPVNERLRNVGGSAKLVIDVLTFDKAIEKAVLYAVGNTLVCDTEAEAKQLAFGRERQKSVTLAGTVIHKSGMMSGGSSSAGQGAKKWTSQKLDGLKKRRDECLQQLDRIAHDLRTWSHADDEKTALASLSAKLRAAEVDLKQLESKRAGLEGEIRAVDAEANAMQPELQSVRGEVESKQKDLARAEKAINDAEDKVFAKFCREVGVSNIREYEQDAVNVARQQNEHLLKLSAQESRITAAINYGRGRNLDGPLKEAAEQVAADEQALKAVKKKLSSSSKQEESVNTDLEKMKSDLKKLAEEEEAGQEAVKKIRKSRTDATSEAAQRRKDVADVEGRVRVLQSRRHAVLRRATVDEIVLPYEDGSAFREPEGTQSQVQVFEAEDRLVFDFSSLRNELRKVRTENEFNEFNANFNAELQSIAMELSRLNPNLKAVEKLKEMQDKVHRVEDELKESRRENQTVTQRFQECREKRFKLFMDCFKHVQQKIEEVYDALTRNDRRSVGGAAVPGGKAFLTLQDPHEPWSSGITYQTIPPTKRLWNYEQLSGGEKSLASLALIFAIQSFRPSPFFVLDEIDAALDAQNLEKLSRFVQTHARDSQFIVISLKDAFFSQADALVGVYRDNAGECSRTLTVDLAARDYQN